MDNAAATTAGQRLIPAPQVTKVGTRILIRLATVLTAKKSSSARLPEPSNNGKRQKTNSRGVCRDGSSAASWTKTFTPKSKIFGKSRLSPAWPSHRGYGSIWFMGTSQLPHEPTAKERSAQEMFAPGARTKFQKLNDFGSWFLVLGSWLEFRGRRDRHQYLRCCNRRSCSGRALDREQSGQGFRRQDSAILLPRPFERLPQSLAGQFGEAGTN